MSLWQRFRSTLTAQQSTADARPRGEQIRDVGIPTSTNRASSMHATWLDVPGRVQSVEAVLTIVDPPVTPHLHFWALQASFIEEGVSAGAGHLGLQWITGHPGGTAVNWGGYRSGGGELEGTASSLSSARNNPHTRDYLWRPGAPYRLRIDSGDVGWRGSVTDVERGEQTVVRELHSSGSSLDSIVVWSEVFAPCDGPTSAVRWSDFTVATEGPNGRELVPIEAVQLSYQRYADGGCTNTDTSIADTGGIVQRTATDRHNAHGEVLRIRERPSR